MLEKITDTQQERITKILRIIFEQKEVTRSELSSASNLSISSINKYIRLLIGSGIVIEFEQDEFSKKDKKNPSKLLKIDKQKIYNIIIVIDSSVVSGYLVNAIGEEILSTRIQLELNEKKAELLSKIYLVIDEVSKLGEAYKDSVLGISIAMGGYLNSKKGISYEKRDTPGWRNVEIVKLVEEKFNLPCFLINDSDACVMGEKYCGEGRGVKDFLCVWLGEGIGMGLILNNELYLGADNYVGEFGHVISDPNGDLCFCGHRGCLETFVSQKKIFYEFKNGINQGVYSTVKDFIEKDEEIGVRHLIKAANNGDILMKEIFRIAAEHISIRLSEVVNILNPAKIILRGPLIDGNVYFYKSIRNMVKDMCLRPSGKNLEISFSKSVSDVRILGANVYLIFQYFSNINNKSNNSKR